MDIGLYRHYLEEFVREAAENSDGTNRGMRDYLREKQIPRFFVRHSEEKRQALKDATQAFEEHSYWPVEIVLSHLGVKLTSVRDK